MGLIAIDKNKCDLSYACVRACPVNAIEVKINKDYARVIPERCIGCGNCLSVCPQDAISYKNDMEITKKILKAEELKVAIVAPSISGEFDDITDYRKFVQMIRALGFNRINEVSFGADVIGLKYAELWERFKGKYYISTLCPVVVSHISKFQPELVENLTPLVTPMAATAKIVRHLYGENIKVVYIGPCVESKNEADYFKKDPTSRIDSVLTFQELRKLFDEFDIHESNLEYSDFDPPIGYKGSLFPIPNGMLQAADISEDLLNGNVITTEGKYNMLEATKEFHQSIDTIKKHFNIFSCEGCLMGPGTSKNGKKYIRHTLVTEYANKRLKDFNKELWEKAIQRFWDLDYTRSFAIDDQRIEMPTEERIQEILKSIGKEEGKVEAGCGACGYDSCRDFAVAVAKGLAKTEMCLTFSLKNRQEYIKALRATNEKLGQTQKALKSSEQNARKEKEAAEEAMETVNAMMEKLPSGIVIIDKHLKVIQSNSTFIEILGEEAESINEVIPGLKGADLKTMLPYNIYNLFSQVLKNNENIVNRDIHLEERLLNLSIFTIKKGSMVGAVFRDMYAPEVRKEEVIKRVTEVIDKNLEMVQKIGFLLGEGASETEQMLNSIIEFYRSQKK